MIFQDKDRIVFAGDSVTDMNKTHPLGEGGGMGACLGDGYVHMIYDMLAGEYPERRIRITNAGISGNTSAQLLERWERDVLDLKPDWVSIFIGINDVLNRFVFPERAEIQVSHEEYSENLEKMIQALDGRTKGIFILSPYTAEPNTADPIRKEMDCYREMTKSIAERHACIYVDIQEMFDEYFTHRHQATVAWDRVHPNRVGAYLIAKAFLKKCGFEYK